MELKKKLGKNVKKYRKANNLTQEKLAELVGVEVISISYIETGRCFPSPDNLEKISNILHISLSDLFDFSIENSCKYYLDEITKNLNFISSDKMKLIAVNSLIKSMI